MRSPVLPAFIALCLVIASANVLHGAADKELIAVLDLQGVGASEVEAAALTSRLREVLLKSGKFTLVDRSQISAVLSEQALQQTGCTEQECAVQVGRILGVRKIVAGEVVKLSAEGWLVSAIMVDVESGETLRAESVQHQGNYFSLLGSGMTTLAGKLAGDLTTAVAMQVAHSRIAQRNPAPATSPPRFSPRTVWEEPITGVKFVAIPGGAYEQGCGSWTSQCKADEKPTRQVVLEPFWLGRTEVTQGQWRKVMESNAAAFKTGDDYPVEWVSWNDVQEFIRRLNAKTRDITYRLPTETEWEYACRAGGRPLEFGTASGQLNRREANYGVASCCGGDASDGYFYTAPVGSYPPNALGLHDMTGNVWEWTQDMYNRVAYRSGAVSDPISVSGSKPVFRGGGWYDVPGYLRCSARGWNTPDPRMNFIGFRLAMTPASGR